MALFRLAAFTALIIFLLEAIGHLLGNVAVFFKVNMRVRSIEDHGALELGVKCVVKVVFPLFLQDLGDVHKSDKLRGVGGKVTERLHGKLRQLVLCFEAAMRVVKSLAEEFNQFGGGGTVICFKVTLNDLISFSIYTVNNVCHLSAVGSEVIVIDFKLVFHLHHPLSEAWIDAVR